MEGVTPPMKTLQGLLFVQDETHRPHIQPDELLMLLAGAKLVPTLELLHALLLLPGTLLSLTSHTWLSSKPPAQKNLLQHS